jgi:hypothetical protein
MKRFLIFTLILSFSSCQSMRLLSGKPSAADVDLAVRQLMSSSVFQAITTLGSLQSENPEMLLPEELRPVLQTLRLAGYGNQIDNISQQLASYSGVAMSELREVLRESIAETSFSDGAAILMGGQNTAVQVLRNNSVPVVQRRYSSLLEEQLKNTDIPTYFPIAANAYNLFAREKIPTQVGDFLAVKAVDVVFTMAGHREQELRNSPRELGEDAAIRALQYYQKQQQKQQR